MKQRTTKEQMLDRELFHFYNAVAASHLTIEQGCEYLLSAIRKGADVNTRSADKTPLLFGITKYQDNVQTQLIVPEITALLFQNGADINVQDSKGNHILHIYAQNKFSEDILPILEFYTEQNEADKLEFVNLRGDTIAHIAATHNNDELLDLINNTETDINLQNKSGNTPLHNAVLVWVNQKNLSENDPHPIFGTIKKLFENDKIDATITNHDDDTALDIARAHEEQLGDNNYQVGDFIANQMRENGVALALTEREARKQHTEFWGKAGPCTKIKYTVVNRLCIIM